MKARDNGEVGDSGRIEHMRKLATVGEVENGGDVIDNANL